MSKKKNILIFCSDSKGTAVLINIVRKIKQEYLDKFNFYFLYSNETQLQYPTRRMDGFRVDCDDWTLSELTNSKNLITVDSLGCKLPWTPDILIIQRERWQPEQSIIYECVSKWDTYVACVDVNSQIVNSYETQFEMISRLNPPQSSVNTFFEGSIWTRDNRKLMLGENWNKGVVVGNPRFDGNPKYNMSRNEQIKEKYNIDDRKIIFVWSLINNTRPKLMDILKNVSDKIDDSKYRILFKPYPGEPLNERFKHQFDGNAIIYNEHRIDNITVIYDDYDTFPLVDMSDIHLVTISSAVLFPLSFNKTIINIQNELGGLDYLTDINIYTNEDNNGVEDSANFWMSVFNLDSKEKFVKLVQQFDINSWKQKNELILESFNHNTIQYDSDLTFLDNITDSNILTQNEIMKYYDEYNDGKSSNRILDYLYNQI